MEREQLITWLNGLLDCGGISPCKQWCWEALPLPVWESSTWRTWHNTLLFALPVIAVTRHNPAQSRLRHALAAAGFHSRLSLLELIPPAHQLEPGLYVAISGAELTDAAQIIRATKGKARFPEPLRIAHLIGTALVEGQSKGRA